MQSADVGATGSPGPSAARPRHALEEDPAPLDPALLSLLDELPDGYFELDLAGRLIRSNRALSELCGYPPGLLQGLSYLQWIDADTTTRLRRVCKQVYATGAPLRNVDLAFVHSDGTHRHAELSIALIHEADQPPRGYRGLLRDISARKRSEAAFRAERDLLRTVIDLVPEQIYVKDSRSRYLIANPAVLRKAGVQAEADMIGKTDFEFFSPRELVERYFADEQAILRSGQPLLSWEEPIVDGQTGTVHWNLTSKVPLRDSDGRVIGLAGVNHDITDRRHAEQELKRRADEFAALYESARILGTEQDLDALLRATLDQVMTLLNAPSGTIFLHDPAAGDLVLIVTTESVVKPGVRLKVGEGMAGRVAETRAPLIVDDYGSWEFAAPQLAGANLGSIVQVPMLFAGNLIGVLGVGDVPSATRKFGEADARLLTLLAGQAASAVHNARLLEETRRLARTDALTGVANRRSLLAAAETELSRARRFVHPLSALMLDIDHFKLVNDAYGHAVGDQVLVAFAHCCLRQIRDIDILGRYGGEEFVILLIETDSAGASTLAGRIRTAMTQIAIATARGPLHFRASIGIAQLRDGDEELDDLLARADQAMYAAKQAGRNQVVVG